MNTPKIILLNIRTIISVIMIIVIMIVIVIIFTVSETVGVEAHARDEAAQLFINDIMYQF
jgi:hypothetical protein